jgi:hypothetical protein
MRTTGPMEVYGTLWNDYWRNASGILRATDRTLSTNLKAGVSSDIHLVRNVDS